MDNQKIIELELTNQKLSQLTNQIRLAENQVEHAVMATAMLEELKGASADQELLVPIGNGIFITVKAADVGKIKMAVGAGVVVDKGVEDALVTVNKQVTEVQQYHQELAKEYEDTVRKAQSLQEELDQSQ